MKDTDATIVDLADTQAMSDTSSERRRTSWRTCCVGFLRRNLLVVLLLLSLLLGLGVGFFIKLGTDLTFTSKDISYISFPGTLFLNMLEMVIIPLVVSSLVSGMASLDKRLSGILGLKALVYYVCTTVIAVTLGIVMVMLIQPGNRQESTNIDRSGNTEYVNTVDSILDLLRNMFPPNVVEACFRSYKTVQTPVIMVQNQSEMIGVTMTTEEGVTMGTTPEPEIMLVSTGGYQYRSNLLGLVVFSFALGITLGRMGPEGEPLRAFANSMMEVIMWLVRYIIWISPIGIFFLIIGKILDMKDWMTVFSQIGLYSATVISSLLIHGLIILPLIFVIFTRKNPFVFIKGVTPALMTAFATASSSATLPLTIDCLEQSNGIDKRVTRFMLPVGTTLIRDGTALYEAVAAIFIAQVNNLEMDVATVLTVSVTATLASIGAAGVPQAGLVTLVIVLNAVGLPAEDVTLIIIIDWFLERIRTTVNVASHSLGAGIVHHRSRERLATIDRLHGNDNMAFPTNPAMGYQPTLTEFNTKL
ncbi:excitatory amino acid transporter 1-like [Acanthaster planci]|uniref:Amino acid transporter n=1 Tax=Acanthaster planci TaxID=133434 RepID=A0A8B7ZB64_ACAPL|nr:excitatory amino acid transporter 1-like [Acanthaster planci]